MRVITWNINSVRLRLDLLLHLVERFAPDVVCLQETKVPDEAFPTEPLARTGLSHLHVSGMKSYNGVAVLSRFPFADTHVFDWCGKSDCRHIAVRYADGLTVHNIYVPSGGDVPDADSNPKFAHKLQFVREHAAWWPTRHTMDDPLVLVGDLNIAPYENDVWSHKQMLEVVSHTPVEVEALESWRRSLNWQDIARSFVPPEEKLYSWWSYRARDWQASDRGRRLDHIWVTPCLGSSVRHFEIVREARGWQPKPSDHVPVIADLIL